MQLLLVDQFPAVRELPARFRARLFSLEVGELFECDIDEGAFRELRELLSG